MGLYKKPPAGSDLLDLHKEWVSKIQDEGLNLTVWEEEFIESIEGQLAGGRHLSEKQAEIVERIYSEKTP